MSKGKAAKERKLTPKEQRFVEEYLIDLNASDAYRRAGYTGKNANVIAPRMLAKAGIAAAIAEAKKTRSERTQITVDRVLREQSYLALSDIGDVLDFSGDTLRLRTPSQIPEHARRAIASVKVKRYVEGAGDDGLEVELTEFKLWDKKGALVDIGKHLGMYVEKHEHTGKDGEPLPAGAPGLTIVIGSSGATPAAA